jgi:endonuclease/exonuclease/phosphatase family metal-dependent hydrolase
MKIATWNIERLQKRKNKEIIQAIKQVNAATLVLTEASDLIDLSDDYAFNSKTILLHDSTNNYRSDERRVIIYSKYPISQTIKTYDEKTSCCAEIETPFGKLFVYGTIIGIYGNRRKCFLEDLDKQIEDINKISQSTNFCFAGDLNISFSDNYYFTTIGREKLNDVFSKNNLINVTKDIPQNIDHIIISANFNKNAICKTTTWNHDKQLSDHIGVCVEFFKKD